MPCDPAARAFARITEDVCDTHYEAVNWGFGEILWFKRAIGELAAKMNAEAARQTVVLQAWLTERLGASPWFGGETFGWADGQSFGPLRDGTRRREPARLLARPASREAICRGNVH